LLSFGISISILAGVVAAITQGSQIDVITRQSLEKEIVGYLLKNESSFSPAWSGLAGLCSGILGMTMALMFRRTLAVIASSLLGVSIALVCIQANRELHTNFPWWILALCPLVTSIIIHWFRSLHLQQRASAFRIALTGRMSPKNIDHIIEHPETFNSAPSGSIVSIMFIDIAGFSQIAERLSPHQAFDDLKDLFDLMRLEVLRYGGIVDKTLGDGMLAYFGYGPPETNSARDHADAALECGVSIQTAVLNRNIRAAQSGKALYPIRIGINTSTAFIGNVGDEHYYDFTLIGNGVNLAKRFEASCQHYSVMIGASTYDLLKSQERQNLKLTRKLIPIKHSEAPCEAYECELFSERKDDVVFAIDAFRKHLGIRRKDFRWPVPQDVNISLESRYGRAILHDFSLSGISIVLPCYIGSGVGMDLVFNVPTQWQRQDVGPNLVLHVEVRWGRAIADGYLHGLLITNLSVTQRENLVAVLRDMIRQHPNRLKIAS
jgi:class 3 adenylate cyclase